MTTNFTKCAMINALVGNHNTANWDDIKKQLKLIQSELKEMEDSIEERNLEKLRDDVCDVLFTTYGMGYRANFPVDSDFEEVCKSQLSKFDFTLVDAELTRRKYSAIGVDTYIERRMLPDGRACYVTYSVKDQVCYAGKDYPKGKYLKSVGFLEPVFYTEPALDPL